MVVHSVVMNLPLTLKMIPWLRPFAWPGNALAGLVMDLFLRPLWSCACGALCIGLFGSRTPIGV